MGSTPLKVAVWGTGGIGSISIHTIHERPDLDLVGVWVYTDAKVGRDAGELANGTPIGLAATNDVDAILALQPDCVVYAAMGPEREAGVVPDYVRILEAGVNVVSTTSTSAIYPPNYDADHHARVSAAAKVGGVSFYASGIEPGFAADQLPVLLATQSGVVSRVYATEMALYDDYPVEFIMKDGLGFGRPLDFEPGIATPGAIRASWAGPVRYIADSLGIELDDIAERFEMAATDETLEVACGTIPAGTCGAVRIQCVGIVGGNEAIIVEHVTRMGPKVAPEWPIGDFPITYRIEIDGEPGIRCEMGLTVDDVAEAGIAEMSSGAGAMVATAMRVVNAIPYVVAAESGFLGADDLPLTVPKTAYRPA
ncbi:MAG TPA: hypothetical protein VIY72_02855 [Acidimicrobiales bacterium]